MDESEPVASQGKKRHYFNPAVTKLNPKQGKETVMDRTNCDEREVEELIESMRRELR